MDSLTKIRCFAALLALLVMPAIILAGGKEEPAADSRERIPFISAKALNGLKDVSKALERRAEADTSVIAQISFMEKAWIRSFHSKLSDSNVASPSPAERLAGAQVQLVDSMFAAAKLPAAPELSSPGSLQADQIAAAISSLVGMEPVMRSLRDSKRSALLVVSSALCPCGRRRCEKMQGVSDSTLALHPNFAISVVDDARMPSVIKILGVTSVPSWVLLDTEGVPASTISGSGDPEDVTSALESWLGEER